MEFENVIMEVRNVSILEVAQRLGISYSGRGSCRMCHCFMHEDENPSLWLKVSGNYWGCPVCQKGGDNIRLVMYHENLKFAQAVRWLAERFGIVIDDARRDALFLPPESNRRRARTRQNVNKTNVENMNLISLNSVYLKQCYSIESPFCRALVSNNILTDGQMRRAALRYHLGMTRDGGVIFWQIDRNERLHDGKIIFYRPDCHRDHDRHPSWVVSRLKQKRLLPDDYQPSRCLFGSHLLASYPSHLPSEGVKDEGIQVEGVQSEVPPDGNGVIVAIVESEKTAIICSELFPKFRLPTAGSELPVVWLATGGLSSLTVSAIAQIATVSASGSPSFRLILFPDTDPTGETYRKWRETAVAAQQELHISVMVSDFLERNATADQKARKIDIADYIMIANK